MFQQLARLNVTVLFSRAGTKRDITLLKECIVSQAAVTIKHATP
jgi:hypothetical protein